MKKRIIKLGQLIAIVSIVSLLTACARPYQAQSGFFDMMGYRSRDVDTNTVEVIYRNQKYTDMYVMYRSAEIARERGYQFFRVLADRSVYYTEFAYAETRVKIFMFNPSPDEKVASESEMLEKKRRIMAGLIFAGDVFSAKDVIENLEEKIIRPTK